MFLKDIMHKVMYDIHKGMYLNNDSHFNSFELGVGLHVNSFTDIESLKKEEIQHMD